MASVLAASLTRFSGYREFLEAFQDELYPSVPSNAASSAHPHVDDPLLAASRITLIDSQIHDLFSYVSINSAAALNLNNHPVTQMVVNYMQKLEDWTWHGSLVKNTLFPNLNGDISPSSFSIDSLQTQPFKEGRVALTVKAFYNAVRGYDDNINVDKFNSGVSALNSYFNSSATALFAEYYRHASKIAPSASAVKQYLILLRSKAYRTLKAAELANGTWDAPALEIFNHFVKLKACGASDDEISAAYDDLTRGSPAIDPSAILPLSASAWKSYRGWLHAGYIDWGDLKAQNLGASYTHLPYSSGRGMFIFPIKFTLCSDYVHHYDYWKSSSGSCFAGNTLVRLADGQSVRAIRDITVGDEVQTLPFSGPQNHGKAKVALVSEVPRDGRTLYELRDKPGVRFTATHPLVLRGKSAMPMLGFVDPDLAASLNPMWHSIPTRTLESVNPHPSSNDENEVLYDLILESPNKHLAHPSIYVLCSPAGQTLEVASEAPIMEWFPYATCFLHSIMEEMKTKGGDEAIAKMHKACKDEISLASILDLAAKSAWQAFLGETSHHCTHPKDIDIHTLFGHMSRDEQKATAIVVENIIGRLGRLINDHINTAWINDSSGKGHSNPFLLIHTLTYLTTQSHPVYAEHEKFRIVVTHNAVAVADHAVTTEREGWMTFEIQHAIPIGADASVFPLDLGLSIIDSEGVLLFKGRGPIEENIITILGLGGVPGTDEAVLKLQIRLLDSDVVDRWQGAGRWGVDERISFASLLGRFFANLMLEGGGSSK